MPKISVVLLSTGEPAKSDEIKEYLVSIYNDPFLFPFPYAKKFLGKLFAGRKEKEVSEILSEAADSKIYKRIVEDFAANFRNELKNRSLDADVYFATRYHKPSIEEVAKQVAAARYDLTITIALKPHYSKIISGSLFREFDRVYLGDRTKLVEIKEYHAHKYYIGAVSERLAMTLRDNGLEKRDNPLIIFCAESISQIEVENGDPYIDQLRETCDLVMKNLTGFSYKLGFHNNLISDKTLEPSVEYLLNNAGTDSVVMVPIGSPQLDFNTLHKLDIEYRHKAKKMGVRNYYVVDGICESEKFVSAMVALVKGAVKFAGY